MGVHMAKPYSLDLRERVLKYLEQFPNRTRACQLFQVGRATVFRWLSRKQKEGHVQPLQRKYAFKRVDDLALNEYIAAHPDQFLSEIAKNFGVSPQSIFYNLKRLNITRKKRPRFIVKEMKK